MYSKSRINVWETLTNFQDIVRELLEKEPKLKRQVDSNGRISLHLAAANAHLEVMTN